MHWESKITRDFYISAVAQAQRKINKKSNSVIQVKFKLDSKHCIKAEYSFVF